LLRWKKISKDEAVNTNWGYDLLVFGAGELDDMYILPYRLIVRDVISNNIITAINSCYTIEEIQKELKRIDFKGNVHVFKTFTVKFELENRGKTDANDIEVKVMFKHDKIEWQEAFKSNAKIDLSAEQISTVLFEFDFPLEIKLPNEMFYKILIDYKNIHDKMSKKEINAKWSSNDNYWSYSNK